MRSDTIKLTRKSMHRTNKSEVNYNKEVINAVDKGVDDSQCIFTFCKLRVIREGRNAIVSDY